MTSFYPYRPAAIAVALLAAAGSVSADTTVYTTSNAFMNAIAPDAYTETFTGGAGQASSFSFASGSYGYSMTAGGVTLVYRQGSFIGNLSSNNTLTLTFTTGNVRAVGAHFFITDSSDLFFIGAPVTVNLSDGTSLTWTPSSSASYRGFIATVPIISLVMAAPGALRYNTLDDLTVGVAAAVPEPQAWALWAAGLLLTGSLVRRRAR